MIGYDSLNKEKIDLVYAQRYLALELSGRLEFQSKFKKKNAILDITAFFSVGCSSKNT